MALFLVAAVVGEGGVLGLGHCGAGDAEGLQGHGVGPLLVVEDEGLVRRRPEHERPTGEIDVSR